MVTVQPSSVVVGGVVAVCRGGVVVGLAGGVVVAAGGRGRVVVRVGFAERAVAEGVVTLGSGAGKLLDSAAGRAASALSSGAAVRRTGSRATEASTMLVAVAAHQPRIGAHRIDRTRP